MKGSSKKFQDWTIDVKKSTIMRTEEMENFQKKYDMPSLPEMIHGQSYVRFVHEQSHVEIK